MENGFDNFLGFQWDRNNIHKNLIKHNLENWECELPIPVKTSTCSEGNRPSVPDKSVQ